MTPGKMPPGFWVVFLLGLVLSAASALDPFTSVFHRSGSLSNATLVWSEPATAFFLSIKRPFSIAAFIGPTRTGKSTLATVAFGENKRTFGIGTGVDSMTTGMTITTEPVANLGSFDLYVLDTEGLNGVHQLTEVAYEVTLFNYALLMSSTVIYNTFAPIDALALHRLETRTDFNTIFRKTAVQKGFANAGSDFSKPAILWVAQNFNKFTLKNSRYSSADDFLKTLLSHGSTGASKLSERVSELHLLPFDKPHTNDEVLVDLLQVPRNQLRREYLEDAENLVGSVKAKGKPLSFSRKNFFQRKRISPIFPTASRSWPGEHSERFVLELRCLPIIRKRCKSTPGDFEKRSPAVAV